MLNIKYRDLMLTNPWLGESTTHYKKNNQIIEAKYVYYNKNEYKPVTFRKMSDPEIITHKQNKLMNKLFKKENKISPDVNIDFTKVSASNKLKKKCKTPSKTSSKTSSKKNIIKTNKIRKKQQQKIIQKMDLTQLRKRVKSLTNNKNISDQVTKGLSKLKEQITNNTHVLKAHKKNTNNQANKLLQKKVKLLTKKMKACKSNNNVKENYSNIETIYV